jgi:hypothetical protein
MYKEFSNTFQFGKVSINGNRKINLVEIEVNLKIRDGRPCFSASANVWNEAHSEIVWGGQCIDSIFTDYRKDLENRKLFEQILRLWEKWHLNDMRASCEHQKSGKLGDFCKKCNYEWGSAWKYHYIEKNDLREIMDILKVPTREYYQILRWSK